MAETDTAAVPPRKTREAQAVSALSDGSVADILPGHLLAESSVLSARAADDFRLSMAKKKKLPKQIAILDEDLCTGCDACVTVCPVDCIDKISDPTHPGYAMGICTIDLPVCIGCKLCAQVCPWHVITMVPTDQILMVPELAGQLQ